MAIPPDKENAIMKDYFPGIVGLAWFNRALTEGEQQVPTKVQWTDHVDFLDGVRVYDPVKALQEVIAILHEVVRDSDAASSPANVDRIVRGLVDHALLVTRHGVPDSTEAIVALFDNLITMER